MKQFLKSRLEVDCRNHHGEGVVWDASTGLLWWTDIEGKALWSYEPATSATNTFEMNDRVCCFAPRRAGGMIVAFADRISLLDLDTGAERKIYKFEPENEETRLNDGRTDRQGRFITGGMNEKSGIANSSVIRVDADLRVTELFDGISCANSISFSPDGQTMYFADTPDGEIIAFDYDTDTGVATNRRNHFSFLGEPGIPDGSCVDEEGGLWNAEWEGSRVIRILPNGQIDRVIELPVSKPTCCAFGGEDLKTLFITTSRLMSDDDMLLREPCSGGLFAVKPGVRGVKDEPFAG